jgi:hypothetical protein
MQNLDLLKQALYEGVVSVTFTKKDGSTREMKATLKSDLLPATPVQENSQKKPQQDPNLVHVYDTQAQGWRSFRMERLQHWQAEV